MAPKLYLTYGSPPARAILMTARAIGIEIEHIELNLHKKEHLQPEYLELNPQHTVPTLVDGDFTVSDSHAILTYLVAMHAKNDHLYPQDPKTRAVIDQRLHFESGVIFAQMLNMFKPIIYEGQKTIEQKHIDGFNETLGILNSFLERKRWVAGSCISVADYSIFASVSSMHSIFPIDEEKFPNVVKWMKKMEKIPATQENNKGLERFSQFIKIRVEM